MDEAGESIEQRPGCSILDLVKGRDIVDLGNMENKKQIGRKDAQLIDVIAARLGSIHHIETECRDLKHTPLRFTTDRQGQQGQEHEDRGA